MVSVSRCARTFGFLALTLIAASCSVNTYASIVVDVSNQGVGDFNGNWTLGYEFTANSNMNLTHLGFFDWNQDGLAQNHQIGIWDTAGNLLSTATVGNADPLTGFFRYTPIAPLTLTAGQNYIIGASNYRIDQAVRSDLGGINLLVSPDISIVDGRWGNGANLGFPGNSTSDPSIFYPTVSFQYTIAVAEPASGMALLFAVTVVAVRRRRRDA